MKRAETKASKRAARHRRIRAGVAGSVTRPRLCVFRSNKAIYAQLIDDKTGKTIAAADSRTSQESTLRDRAEETGKRLASLAREKKVQEVVFDRGGFQYTGAIEALARGAREGGLVL